ncbi:cytochrome P450 [Calycina marina]|uniref:Cytochrome P450 n=1 Tax=Calycina marina TaxID=1763456 RepID=A0A9P7YVH5_9HELO|nr:cytochrome P450 [Calycina marina]
MPRMVPEEEMLFQQSTIPRGTAVSMKVVLIHQGPPISPDSNSFDPERWLKRSDHGRLYKYLVPFSAGSRMCLDMILAWTELYLGMSRMVLWKTVVYDVQLHCDLFILIAKDGSQGVWVMIMS